MRASHISSLLALCFVVSQAAQAADIEPDPQFHGVPLGALAAAGTALTIALVSFGLWLRKRALARTSGA
jgi:hypothetical protein